MNDPNSVVGVEFDWFAVDQAGRVGHFASAGSGPIPSRVLENLNAARALGRQILHLPVLGDAVGHLPGRIDDWLEMARRGLFSYDWQIGTGPYHRAATPSAPISLTDIPAELAACFAVRFPSIRFADLVTITPEQLGL